MAWAAAMTSAWPAALGADRLALSAPSLFTAKPVITASMGSPSARASSRRRSATMPMPSPNTVPPASRLKGRQ